jgi:hypothetical protein
LHQSPRTFLADRSPDKRDRLIDQLLDSPAFYDRWTMYFDDLFQVASSLSNVYRDTRGSNTFHTWVLNSVQSHKSIAQMARELLTGTGNNFDMPTATANHLVSAYVDNGPPQDFFDKAAVNAIKIFHGNARMDCIGCHSGRGHTEAVSAWATSKTRRDLWQIAAFFSRTQISGIDGLQPTDPYYNSLIVSDFGYGSYDLNTDYGNRPVRAPIGDLTTVTPVYFDGSTPSTDQWRQEFANDLISDKQFALNFANRLFGQVFGIGLVAAVDQLDPLRLDPAAP